MSEKDLHLIFVRTSISMFFVNKKLLLREISLSCEVAIKDELSQSIFVCAIQTKQTRDRVLKSSTVPNAAAKDSSLIQYV